MLTSYDEEEVSFKWEAVVESNGSDMTLEDYLKGIGVRRKNSFYRT
jgi:hypothetical protein